MATATTRDVAWISGDPAHHSGPGSRQGDKVVRGYLAMMPSCILAAGNAHQRRT